MEEFLTSPFMGNRRFTINNKQAKSFGALSILVALEDLFHYKVLQHNFESSLLSNCPGLPCRWI